jgi:hypothetical protein
MTAPHYSKILASVEENMYNLGYSGKAKRKWFGDVVPAGGTKPVAASLMNFTDNANSAGDKVFVARLRYDEVAGLQWPDSMTTRSHATGYFAQGNAFAELYFEAPDFTTLAAAKGHLKFIEDVLHIYRGQFGTRVRVLFCPNGTKLEVNGVDGAVADSANMTEMGVYLPYGRIAAAGELA